MTRRPVEPSAIRDTLHQASAPHPDMIAARQALALDLLREWFPDGGTLYVVRRRRTAHGNLVVDCKRISVIGTLINIGVTVADALQRPYLYPRDGFYCSKHETAALFDRDLSIVLYGVPGKLKVEWI